MLYLWIGSILLFIIIYVSQKEPFVGSVQLPCARPKVLFSYDKLNYVKCIGINENTKDDEQNEYKSRMMNIPFYHIHQTFSDMDTLSMFVQNELTQLETIRKRFPIGPCYLLVGRNATGLDTWILFPNFVKARNDDTLGGKPSSVPNLYTLTLYHQWTHLLINHPFYDAPNECGIPTTPIRSNYVSTYPTPQSHCPNIPVTMKKGLYSGKNDTYGNITCNYYTDYFFQPCGCANINGCSYVNLELIKGMDFSKIEKNIHVLKNNYIYALYIPNTKHSLFSNYSITGLNRSCLINGQEITTRDYTWILSENGNARLELHNDGIYIYANGSVVWSFYKLLDPRVSQMIFEGTILKLMVGGITQWQKNFLTGDSKGTSPYVLQLTNEGKFQIIDAKGNMFV